MSGVEPFTEWRVEWRKPEGGPWMQFCRATSEADAVRIMEGFREGTLPDRLRVAKRTRSPWEPMA